MYRHRVVVPYIVVTCVVVLLPYSTNSERSVIADENPFRINKLNFVWEKAVHRLSDKAILKRLKIELDKFDGLYLTAKSEVSKGHKFAPDEIDVKLEQTLEKYELQGVVSAFNKKMKWRNEEEQKNLNSVLGSDKFTDPKLQKLWKAALEAQFTEYQLKALHKELKDHERKMQQYEEKVAKFNKIPHENTLAENSLERREELNRELKELYSDMSDSYDKLHEKVLGTAKGPFKNEKVHHLWSKAVLNANFTPSELESIRVELQHFDRQLEKLKFHEEEMDAAKEVQRKAGKANVISDSLDEFEQHHAKMKRKMKKLETLMESRVKHTEL